MSNTIQHNTEQISGSMSNEVRHGTSVNDDYAIVVLSRYPELVDAIVQLGTLEERGVEIAKGGSSAEAVTKVVQSASNVLGAFLGGCVQRAFQNTGPKAHALGVGVSARYAASGPAIDGTRDIRGDDYASFDTIEAQQEQRTFGQRLHDLLVPTVTITGSSGSVGAGDDVELRGGFGDEVDLNNSTTIDEHMQLLSLTSHLHGDDGLDYSLVDDESDHEPDEGEDPEFMDPALEDMTMEIVMQISLRFNVVLSVDDDGVRMIAQEVLGRPDAIQAREVAKMHGQVALRAALATRALDLNYPTSRYWEASEKFLGHYALELFCRENLVTVPSAPLPDGSLYGAVRLLAAYICDRAPEYWEDFIHAFVQSPVFRYEYSEALGPYRPSEYVRGHSLLAVDRHDKISVLKGRLTQMLAEEMEFDSEDVGVVVDYAQGLVAKEGERELQLEEAGHAALQRAMLEYARAKEYDLRGAEKLLTVVADGVCVGHWFSATKTGSDIIDTRSVECGRVLPGHAFTLMLGVVAYSAGDAAVGHVCRGLGIDRLWVNRRSEQMTRASFEEL